MPVNSKPDTAPSVDAADRSTDNAITLVDVLNILLRQRWWILLPALALMLLLPAWAMLSAPDEEYEASSTFVSDDRSAPDESSALARQLGLSRGASTPTGTPTYYAALINSRPLLRTVVAQPYRTVVDGDTVEASLVEIWGITRPTREAELRAAAARLSRAVETTVDRNTGFVTVTASAREPALAEQLADELIRSLQRYNVAEHRARAADEASFLAEQLAEAQLELAAAQDSLASFLRRNRSIGEASELMFRRERLQRQVELRQEMVLSLVRSLEQLRMEQARDMNIVRVVESADGSAVPAPDQAILPLALIGAVVGIVFGILLAFLAEFFRRVRTGARADYAELRALVGEVGRLPREGLVRLQRRMRRERRRT